MNNIHTLVIPDIHGRKFWKEALEKFPKESFQNLSLFHKEQKLLSSRYF